MARSVFSILVFGVAAYLLSPSMAGPVGGGSSAFQRIEVGEEFRAKVMFEGGKRSCIVVEGDHNPITNITIQIEDSLGNLVTTDDFGGDFVAVVWYPPKTAEYLIRVTSDGRQWNKCYIAVH